MDIPENPKLPFFAYGLFKPGEITYLRIKDFTDKAEIARVKGILKLRDGIPILDIDGKTDNMILTEGILLSFKKNKSKESYQQIVDLEPDKQYRWEVLEINLSNNESKKEANVLVGKNPEKGSMLLHDSEGQWGWKDPFFNKALDIIEEILSKNKDNFGSLEQLFYLEMAYLLLWSSIERYVTFRYSFSEKIFQKVLNLQKEDAFVQGLKEHVNKEGRNRRKEWSLFRTDNPNKEEKLDLSNPKGCIGYYYQVRSNITHRGKGIYSDINKVLFSLEELLKIFRDVLKSAQKNAK